MSWGGNPNNVWDPAIWPGVSPIVNPVNPPSARRMIRVAGQIRPGSNSHLGVTIIPTQTSPDTYLGWTNIPTRTYLGTDYLLQLPNIFAEPSQGTT